jgi:hypothetical protein
MCVCVCVCLSAGETGHFRHGHPPQSFRLEHGTVVMTCERVTVTVRESNGYGERKYRL